MAKLFYQGHASLRIETNDGHVVFVDPFAGEGYSYPADLVLITHEHYDHNGINLVKLKETTVIIRAKDALIDGQYLDFDYFGVHVQAVPAGNKNHPTNECVGYLISVDGALLYDMGDIYTIDLKQIWEDFHPNISFPQFKYWYFNANSTSKDKVVVMPYVRQYIYPRQKINVEARGENLLSDLRELILSDFEYISDLLFGNFRNTYFTIEDFAQLMREKYGMDKARIIANSLYCTTKRNIIA